MPSPYGRCPHCERVHPLRVSGGNYRLAPHLYRPPGKKYQDCPGEGKPPLPGSVK